MYVVMSHRWGSDVEAAKYLYQDVGVKDLRAVWAFVRGRSVVGADMMLIMEAHGFQMLYVDRKEARN